MIRTKPSSWYDVISFSGFCPGEESGFRGQMENGEGHGPNARQSGGIVKLVAFWGWNKHGLDVGSADWVQGGERRPSW